MTSNPKDLSDALIQVMKEEPKICRHLHLPLQSGSSALLKRMNRHYTKESYLELVRKIRKELPDMSLTTDIIVGFPGETDADFRDTIEVVQEAKYDSAFTFIYSKRSGTPAAAWEPVDPEVVKARFAQLLEVVKQSSAENEGKDEGRIMEVLVEEKDNEKPGFLTGRLSNNILVHFEGSDALIGELVSVRLDQSMGFYYYGTLVNE